jgi:hypothetical protein
MVYNFVAFITIYKGLFYEILKRTHFLSVGYRKEDLNEEIVHDNLFTR